MSQQPAQDQVKAAIARLEVELASDGVVLRSQPPELPPGDDAPLLGLGSSHHGSRSLAPSEHELSRRLAEQSQRRAEGAASGRIPTAGSGNEGSFGGGGGTSGGGGGGGGGGRRRRPTV